MISEEIKNDVKKWVSETLTTLNRDIPIDIRWGKFSAKLGDARFSNGVGIVRFSSLLWPRATEVERKETVIHEVCHVVARFEANERGERISPHGPQWKALMHRCGVPPSRTHSVKCNDLSVRKKIPVKCGCREFKITPYVAGRIANGSVYKCTSCNVAIKVPDGTKPVKKRRRRRV